MKKIEMTPDIENALKLFSMAVGLALEDEEIDAATRSRIASRVNGTMSDVIDGQYQHVVTITVNV